MNGLSDPFIKLTLDGKPKDEDNKAKLESYIFNSKMLSPRATVPFDSNGASSNLRHHLHVCCTVVLHKDWTQIGDAIGEVTIDLCSEFGRLVGEPIVREWSFEEPEHKIKAKAAVDSIQVRQAAGSAVYGALTLALQFTDGETENALTNAILPFRRGCRQSHLFRTH